VIPVTGARKASIHTKVLAPLTPEIKYQLADRHSLGQAGWFLWPDCTPSSERQQFRIPPVRNARRALIAARWCCCKMVLHSASSDRTPFDRRGVAGMANFKIYLLRQFCSNGVDFFYNTQETQTQKNDGPEF